MDDNIEQIVGDKLNKDNYHIWLYRMENFLMEKRLWGLMNGEDECPQLPDNYNAEEQKEYKTWIEKSRKYKSLDTSISIRGTMPDFHELVALFMIEEVKLGLNALGSGNSRDHAFFQYRGRGSSRGHSSSRNAKPMDMPTGRGRSNSRGRERSQAPGDCYHCVKYGHFEKDCYYKHNSQRGRGRSHYAAYGNFSTKSSYRDYGRDNTFAMEHVLNSMSKLGNNMNWYIDSGCKNHMTSIRDWFDSKEALKTKDYMEIGDDTLDMINDVGNVSLVQRNGVRNTLSDVLHVPSITNNLVWLVNL
ncbi:hypothetical protein KP509_34G055300 [Ceratopteris richardii]|uniref:CCHC-type domain-containing protein n=1 Tax=Ceratopteris richardii TaxID=49495 RepID=A0A8T2QLD1_CERRI|nr:hypothetical protein KP509_34G055300 [Ceratopteris richardii]